MTATIHLPGKTIAECAAFYTGKLGWSIVSIPWGSKIPVHEGWNKRGGYVTSPAEALKTWGRGQNMGLLLGPSGSATFDVDAPEYARIALAAVGIDLDDRLKGAVRINGNPAKAKAVYRVPAGIELPTHKLVWPSREPGGKATVVFELRAGEHQDILPPSIHPDTKQPYTWNVEFWENGGIPEVDPALLPLWQEWDKFRPLMENACPWKPEAPPAEAARITREYSTSADWDDVREEIRRRVSLEGLLAEMGVESRGNGKYLCPFHPEKNPSFWTFDSAQGYRLWTCAHGSAPVGYTSSSGNAVGDVLDIFQFKEGLSGPGEATTALARREGIALPSAKPPTATVEIVKAPATESPLVFPEEVMTGAAAKFAHLYADLEFPVQFAYMSFLTALGSVVSGSITIDTEIRPQPRLFCILLAPPGAPRKSTAIDRAIDFFKSAVDQFGWCGGVGSAEGLQKALEARPHLLLSWDEFKVFVSKCRCDGSVLLPCVGTLFEKNFIETHTKKASIRLDNVHLSMLSASTVDTYQHTWVSSFTDIGFGSRLWLVAGEGPRKYFLPPAVDNVKRNEAAVSLREVIRLAKETKTLTLEPDANARLQEWYLQIPKTIHSLRLEGYAARLIVLLAINDMKTSVDLATAEKVIKLCEHQLRIRKKYDPVDADNVIARVEENIRRHLGAHGPITDAALKRAVNAKRNGLFMYRKAIENLMKEGEVILQSKRYSLLIEEG